MKKTNHFYRFCALALSCLLLISLLPVTQVLADGDGAIHIKSAEDLRSLAHSCTLDSWSRGKTVVLDNDIELTDDDELPIPTFGGTFNGNGHTISGLSITQSVSPAGLFGVLQKDAVIKNLNVEGTVTPSGDSENIGGIVKTTARSKAAHSTEAFPANAASAASRAATSPRASCARATPRARSSARA
jgi:hypothetical protein